MAHGHTWHTGTGVLHDAGTPNTLSFVIFCIICESILLMNVRLRIFQPILSHRFPSQRHERMNLARILRSCLHGRAHVPTWRMIKFSFPQKSHKRFAQQNISQMHSAVWPPAPLALQLLAQEDGALPSRLLHHTNWNLLQTSEVDLGIYQL